MLLAAGAASGAQPAVVQHLTAVGTGPLEVALGPNGNAVWFTEGSAGTLGKITDHSNYSRFFIPTRNSRPVGITAGPDGDLWFTESRANRIGHVVALRVREIRIPAPGGDPRGIAAGPDGALWFTEVGPNRIGRITTAGQFRQFRLHTPHAVPSRITTGSDGALWFTETGANAIGRITTGGVTREFRLPHPGAKPFGIAPGPDGALWFTEPGVHSIGRITTAGVITQYPLSAGSTPKGITLGADGNLWFTDPGTNTIGQITTSGTITTYALGTARSGAVGITTGIRGQIWVAESGTRSLAQLDIGQPRTQYVSVGATFIQQNPPRATPGTTVRWTVMGPRAQSITDATGMGKFDSGPLAVGAAFSHTFTAAGDYPYRSTTSGLHATYKIVPLVVPASGATSTSVSVTWASQPAPAGFAYDVQVQRPGGGEFTDLHTGTTAASGAFTPDAGKGTYSFRARLVDVGLSPVIATGWSSAIAFTAS